MNTKYNNEEFNQIVSHILEDKDFQKLKEIHHHDSNRFIHSLKVSYYSYHVAKVLHLNYDEVARGGLLHDFFIERTINFENPKDKVLLYTTKHPMLALQNAKEHFELTEKEEDMIKSHMFPLDFRIPKYAESWIVNLVDTGVSVFEFSKKFGYKFSYVMNLYLLFLLNMMK